MKFNELSNLLNHKHSGLLYFHVSTEKSSDQLVGGTYTGLSQIIGDKEIVKPLLIVPNSDNNKSRIDIFVAIRL